MGARGGADRDGGLAGAVVLVTGASRGLGAALARRCARDGARLVITARDEPGLARVAADLAGSGSECLAVRADVSNESDVTRLVEQAVARFGRVDVLINNAAVCRYGAFEALSIDQDQEMLEVNLKAPILVALAVLPLMRRQGGGDIVNVASSAALSGVPRLAVYSASKAGLLGFSRALGKELAGEPVRVFCSCPGWLDTRMLDTFPSAALPARTGMLSPDAAAAWTLRLLRTPRYGSAPILSRLVARAARTLRREPFPVFRFS